MAAKGGSCFFSAAFSPVVRSSSSSSDKFKPNNTIRKSSTRRFAVSTEQHQQQQVSPPARTERSEAKRYVEDGRLETKGEREVQETMKRRRQVSPYLADVEEMDEGQRSMKDFFEEAKDLIRSAGGGDGGSPRWFSPLECGSRLENSPLLLFLPGIDGVGLGLIRHHHKLGKIFDIWCLHIPVKDRTSFTDLVKLVERTVRAENYRSPERPIYLVGESLGACLALAVAARNTDIDLVLILANPATSFEKSQLRPLVPLVEFIPEQVTLEIPYIQRLMTGDPLRAVMDNMATGLSLQQAVGGLSQDVVTMSSYLPLRFHSGIDLGKKEKGSIHDIVLADILPKETLIWKLQMLKSASSFTNSRLHAVQAQTLILASGRDQFLPSLEEGQRLRHILPKCDSRKFNDNGHFLFLEDGVDLVTIIKGASFYRRGRFHDYISDYIPPTPSEVQKVYESNRWILLATSPVMLSTLEDGKVVRSLVGVPSEGPVLFVGYHMLLGFELTPLVLTLLRERNILLRGIAHPMMFTRAKEGRMPELSQFDAFRLMGAVPVSGSLFYKLFSSKAHVLLYPGGMREACHRKGEEYKLIWPEQSEFVRMAARFGAKIVPFGVVGEDDFWEVVFDYDDQMKIPFLRQFIKEITEEVENVRPELGGELGNQDVHLPGVLPKFPGRFYFYFGKPIETEARKHELRDREKAHKLYLQVKSEVEKCIEFLKEKRERDPYRNILARLAYQTTHGFDSEVPTFEL